MTLARLLTRTEAAALLGVKRSTLEAWAVRGGGPVITRVGRLSRYSEADLIRWMEARRIIRTGIPAENCEGGAA